MSYSQHDEEEKIVAHFGDRVGRFLDVGAHNGVFVSNTRRLWELGWSGVLVEPDPIVFTNLMANYALAANPGAPVKLVNCAVTPKSGLGEFFSSPGGVSTFSLEHRMLWERDGGAKYETMFSYGVSFTDLFATFPPPYDFITIDVEGGNWGLLQTLDLEACGAELVCVEYESYDKEVTRFLDERGFDVTHTTRENFIATKRGAGDKGG